MVLERAEPEAGAGPREVNNLADKLIEVHTWLRGQLRHVRADADAHFAAQAAHHGPGEPSAPGLGLQIRQHCLAFCQSLEFHHTSEDGHLFPALASHHPHLRDALDRLRDEHRTVARIQGPRPARSRFSPCWPRSRGPRRRGYPTRRKAPPPDGRPQESGGGPARHRSRPPCGYRPPAGIPAPTALAVQAAPAAQLATAPWPYARPTTPGGRARIRSPERHPRDTRSVPCRLNRALRLARRPAPLAEGGRGGVVGRWVRRPLSCAGARRSRGPGRGCRRCAGRARPWPGCW